MKKESKKTIMALIIIVIFAVSSLAIAANNIFGPQETNTPTTLDKSVIDGDINQITEQNYVQRGFTFLRYYYENDVPSYVNEIPSTFTTNSNQIQLFVLKIHANSTYVKITNLNGVSEINATQDIIYNTLCEMLVVTPSECGLRNLFINQTSA